MQQKMRCEWVTNDPLYMHYHDVEWGVPLYDEKHLFEFLILEGMQAGLSWLTILKKRENYRVALDHFNVKKIAAYDSKKFEEKNGDSLGEAVSAPDAVEFFAFGRATQNAVST